ncbi:13806_t:CDS:2 [Entrophospora sp. SA101]|nr:13806_t:CDS:2 [Entrophospora sp. SA101]CAJ0889706.1 1594_t:CDS:2 [Entrophospora sp. SA101]
MSQQQQILEQQQNYYYDGHSQIFQQQTQPTQNLDQEIIAFDNSLSIIKVANVNNNHNMLSSHTSSSPSTNNNINNDRHQYSLNNRDLNLNGSSFNSRNNNEDPLIAAISHHI